MIKNTTTINFNNDIASVPMKKEKLGILALIEDSRRNIRNSIADYASEDLLTLVKKSPVRLMFKNIDSINEVIKSLKSLKTLMKTEENIESNKKLFLRVDELRQNAGVTFKAVSRETGIEYNTLIKYKNNTTKNINVRDLDKLTKYFKCDIEDLFEYR